jgi:hypothetical protein
VSGLAHYLEDEGLSTVIVALVREHVESMRPPRALWVPFELGRPFGAPNEPELQLRVLRAALNLFDGHSSGPVIEDFLEEAPYPQGNPNWLPPDVSKARDLCAEVSIVRASWELAKQNRQGSTYGISHLSPEQAVEYVASYFSDSPMENPKGMARISRARFAIDDIKVFYFEAAIAGGGYLSTQQLNDWFWEKTLVGVMIREFQEAVLNSDDSNLRLISGSLVPAERTNRYR